VPGNAISSDTVFMAYGPLVCSFTGTKSLDYRTIGRPRYHNRFPAQEGLLTARSLRRAGHNLMLPPPKRLSATFSGFG
jgi:hypothetical protein